MVGSVHAAELWTPGGERLAHASAEPALAPAASAIVVDGDRRVVLSVSVTDATDFAYRLKGLTGLEVVIVRGERPLASTVADPERTARVPRDDRLTTLDLAAKTTAASSSRWPRRRGPACASEW